MADEALASFQLLLTNVPTWLQDLEAILSSAVQQQTALVAEQPIQTYIKSLRTSLASSLRSNRSHDAAAVDIHCTPPVPTLLNKQLPHLTGSDMLRLSQRKRETASVCSRAGSQANKYRSRSMVAIYYDGNAQKGFETLVRAIGTSRNAIRKGKLSMKIDSLSRTGSSSSNSSGSGEETIKSLPTFTYRTTTTLRRPNFNEGLADGTAAFDKVDTALEKAQMSCEHAAHQLLRDGDCRVEITKAKEHLDQAVSTINAELPSLQKKAQKSLQRKAIQVEKDEKDGLEAKPLPTSVRNNSFSLPSDGVLEVDWDELADDTESEDFDITTMQFPPRLTKYTTSLPQLQGVVMVR